MTFKERERERIIKQYGLRNPTYRIIDVPVYEPNNAVTHNRPKANKDTVKSRSNYGSSMMRTLTIARNNNWNWYGKLYVSNENITDFAALHIFRKAFTKRLQKTRERSKQKNLGYLIIPDFELKEENPDWFIHIWLMNYPNDDKCFHIKEIADKKLMYFWPKFEQSYGRTELYKIYDSGYVTNGQYCNEIDFGIFEIMERTGKVTPKETNLYFYSDGYVQADIEIARGYPVEGMNIPMSEHSNGFVGSLWLKELEDAMQYLHVKKPITQADIDTCTITWDDIVDIMHRDKFYSQKDETFVRQLPRSSEKPKEAEEPDVSCYEENPFKESCNGCGIVSDDYIFFDGTENCKPVEDFDYSVLNEIYEKEVYSFD